MANVTDHRTRATRRRHGTEMHSRGSSASVLFGEILAHVEELRNASRCQLRRIIRSDRILHHSTIDRCQTLVQNAEIWKRYLI